MAFRDTVRTTSASSIKAIASLEKVWTINGALRTIHRSRRDAAAAETDKRLDQKKGAIAEGKFIQFDIEDELDHYDDK